MGKKVRVKLAKLDDLREVLEVARAWNRRDYSKTSLEFDDESVKRQLAGLVVEEGRVLILALGEDGRVIGDIAGVVVPSIWCDDEVWGHCISWHVLPGEDCGAELLSAFELWAENHGARWISLSSVRNHRGFGRLVGKFGYEQSEVCFRKEV